MRLLVLNAGSSSLKFDLIEVTQGPMRRLTSGAFAETNGDLRLETADAAPAPAAPLRSLAAAADFLLDWLGGAGQLAGLTATVHRIVHGGERFRATTRLGDAELTALAALDELAPLHNPPALAVIASVRARLPGDVPLIGVFDTAYYASLPEAAWRYAVPERWYRDFGVRRYGFHGTAHRYLCQAARARLPAGRPARRVISLQLGRGCSVTATLDEQPVATSMGFTPLEGLVMGTRSGDLDPGAVLHVMEHGGLSPAQMNAELNTASGLKGLAGRSGDMRELLALEGQGQTGARLAIEIFCRRARHYLGGYAGELGGVDVIAFGGGIGEHAPEIRRRIVGGLEWAGITIDPLANGAPDAASIAAAGSRAAVEVIRLDEASVLAAEAAALLARVA
ncbi:MAG TPA: acetate/propionate family kinase [Steroidobacteraceae bacterium]|nr:acetate/propionate family kinase [Gammaproteobacteria bacterium]HEV2286364.1 acetate/propionate family kinase [Steroidobacteraceae bacterium]